MSNQISRRSKPNIHSILRVIKFSTPGIFIAAFILPWLISSCMPSLSSTPNTIPTMELLSPSTTPVVYPTNIPPVTQSATPTGSPTGYVPTATSETITTPSPSETAEIINQVTSDLLFIAGGNLQRWDHVTNFTHLLVDNVSEFSVNTSGTQIALLRPRKITANGVALFDINVLNLESKQITQLIDQISQPYPMSISPDGLWLAYQLKDNGGMIYAINTSGGGEPIVVGECNKTLDTHCEEIVWSPDSKMLLWDDTLGVWVRELSKPSPNLIRSDFVEITDPKGAIENINVSLTGFDWSPMGRYVLTEVVPLFSDIHWRGLLDASRGRLIEIPYSYEASTATALLPVSSTKWLDDGRLLVIHGILPDSEPGNKPSPTIEVWRLLDTKEEVLILEKRFSLHSTDFPLLTNTEGVSSVYRPAWIEQIDNATIFLGISVPDSSNSAVLFAVDLIKETLDKVAELPYDTLNVLWAPDGGGALIVSRRNQVYFIPMNSNHLYDLRDILGADAHHFIWLPPMPRQ